MQSATPPRKFPLLRSAQTCGNTAVQGLRGLPRIVVVPSMGL